MVPWVIIYGINILGLFGGSIFLFYSLDGSFKCFGILPLTLACVLLVGHFTVLYFLVEQRTDFLSGACDNFVDSGHTSPT